jgi:hypothetical protein
MDPLAQVPCRRGVKALAALAFAALVMCAAVLTKLSIPIAADTTPAVVQRVSLGARSGRTLDDDLRPIAVAPG